MGLVNSHSHILCKCSGITQVRTNSRLEFNSAVQRLPCGPMQTLGGATVDMLFQYNPICERGQRWTRHKSANQRTHQQGPLQALTLSLGQRVLRAFSAKRCGRLSGLRNGLAGLVLVPERTKQFEIPGLRRRIARACTYNGIVLRACLLRYLIF